MYVGSPRFLYICGNHLRQRKPAAMLTAVFHFVSYACCDAESNRRAWLRVTGLASVPRTSSAVLPAEVSMGLLRFGGAMRNWRKRSRIGMRLPLGKTLSSACRRGKDLDTGARFAMTISRAHGGKLHAGDQRLSATHIVHFISLLLWESHTQQ